MNITAGLIDLTDQPVVDTAAGQDALLALDGCLDAEAAVSLRHRLSETINMNPASLVIDLTHLEELDGAGLAAIVWGLMESRRHGIPALAIAPTGSVARRIIDLTGLASALSCES